VKAAVAVCGVGELESVICTVKLSVPVDVGVPEICPVAAFRLRPVGNVPAMTAQAYGVVPPLAVSVSLYAVSCCAVGNVPEPRLMVSVVAVTVRLSD